MKDLSWKKAFALLLMACSTGVSFSAGDVPDEKGSISHPAQSVAPLLPLDALPQGEKMALGTAKLDCSQKNLTITLEQDQRYSHFKWEPELVLSWTTSGGVVKWSDGIVRSTT